MMKARIFFMAVILMLTSCFSTRNWQSTDTEQSFNGSFEEFSGMGLLKEIKLNDQTIELDYSLKKIKGELTFQVESKRKGVILNKKVVRDINESFSYNTVGDDILYIKLIAELAEGEYNIDYHLK